MKRLLLPYIFLLVTAGALPAQQVQITQQDIPPQASFAQPFDVRFELAHTPGYQVELDEKSLPQDFLLTRQKQEIISPDALAYDLTFLPVTLGASTFTAVNFVLLDANRQSVAQTESKSTPVQIAEVQFFKDKKMRDIRPPYIPSSWVWWLLSAIVLGLLIYFLRRFWRDARAAKATQPIVDLRPADVIALDKIHLLMQSGLWEKQQYKLFYTELENILREYLMRRFHLDVSSDTSAELLRRARQIPQLLALQPQLRQYLNSSDLVKFAKATPDNSTMQQDVLQVRTVVQNTSPQQTSTEQVPQKEVQ